MKLYTEEQVKEMLSMTDMIYYNALMPNKDIISCFKPIELPSDEEIENEGKEIWGKLMDEKAFVFGAKRMKEQILNQNQDIS